MKEFCCNKMSEVIKVKKFSLIYNRRFRRYGIRTKDCSYVYQLISYCPWCGTKLPKDLTEELSYIVFDELDMDSHRDKRLPKEYKSDEWWKKRNL